MTENTGNNTPGEGPQAGSEQGSGKSELAALIEQYEAGKQTDGGHAADIAKVVKAVEPAVTFVEEQKAKAAVESHKARVEKAIESVMDNEALAGFKQKPSAKQIVRDFMHGFAERTPEFNEAFSKADADPGAFEAILERARTSFITERLPEFTTDRSDIEAAKAAVAGQTASSPGPSEGPTVSEMFSMSDADWKKHTARKLAEAASA